MATLQDKIRSNNQMISTTTKTVKPLVAGEPTEEPSAEEYLDTVAALQNLKRQEIPGDTTDWDAKLKEAKQLYQDKADRNAWLSVAETIGRGLLKLGAANEGLKKGVDMSRLDLGPSLLPDQQRQAERDYDRDINSVDMSRKLSENKRKMDQDRADVAYGDEARGIGAENAAQKDIYNQRMQNYREDLRDKARNAAVESQTIRSENREASREAERERRRKESEDKASNQAEIRRIDDLIRENRKKVAEAGEIANSYQNWDNMDKKGQDRTEQKLGDLAGRSGIDPDQLAQISEKSKEGTGIFGFMKSEDPKKKANLLNQQIVNPLKQELAKLEEQRRQLSQGSRSGQQEGVQSSQKPIPQSNSEVSADSTPSKEATGSDPRIVDYAKQYGLDYAKARDILVGRGYKPAE